MSFDELLPAIDRASFTPPLHFCSSPPLPLSPIASAFFRENQEENSKILSISDPNFRSFALANGNLFPGLRAIDESWGGTSSDSSVTSPNTKTCKEMEMETVDTVLIEGCVLHDGPFATQEHGDVVAPIPARNVEMFSNHQDNYNYDPVSDFEKELAALVGFDPNDGMLDADKSSTRILLDRIIQLHKSHCEDAVQKPLTRQYFQQVFDFLESE